MTKESYIRGVRAARKRADMGPLTLADVRRAHRHHIENGVWAISMENTPESPHLGQAKREEVNLRFWSLWNAHHGTDSPAPGVAAAQPRSSRQLRAIAPTLVGPRDPALPPAPLFLVDGLGHSPSTRPPRSPTAQRPSLASAVKRASRADRQAASSPPVEHFEGPAGFSSATEVPDGFAQAGQPQQPAPPLSVEDYTTDGFLDGFVEQCVTRPHERALLRACLVDLGLDCKERFDEVPYDRATLESLVSAEVNRYTAVQVSKRLFGAPTPSVPEAGQNAPENPLVTPEPHAARSRLFADAGPATTPLAAPPQGGSSAGFPHEQRTTFQAMKLHAIEIQAEAALRVASANSDGQFPKNWDEASFVKMKRTLTYANQIHLQKYLATTSGKPNDAALLIDASIAARAKGGKTGLVQTHGRFGHEWLAAQCFGNLQYAEDDLTTTLRRSDDDLYKWMRLPAGATPSNNRVRNWAGTVVMSTIIDLALADPARRSSLLVDDEQERVRDLPTTCTPENFAMLRAELVRARRALAQYEQMKQDIVEVSWRHILALAAVNYLEHEARQSSTKAKLDMASLWARARALESKKVRTSLPMEPGKKEQFEALLGAVFATALQH